MTKDFSKGNQHGHEDGKEGDNHLAMRSVKRLFQPDQLLPGAENRHGEYRRGYLTGFEDEVRVTHVTVSSAPATPSSANPGASAMSHATSYAYQIELLQHLKQYLADFQERLLGVSANYQRKVDELHGEGGWMDETHRDFAENQLDVTRAMIANLVNHIAENDIPAVEREIGRLEPFL